MAFHNPYHFIPAVKGKRAGDIDKDSLRDDTARSAVTHAEYAKGTYSGRLLCKLTTVSPCFVGSARREREGAPATVEPFRLDGKPDGEPAIPGSSLRGMISSIAEAASNSAMRVLGENNYSFRRAMDPKECLSAIGMVRVQVVEGKKRYLLMPLTLPTLTANHQGLAELPKEYRSLFPEPALKVYIGNSASIRRPNFGYETFRADKADIFYFRLYKRQWDSNWRLPDDDYQNRKPYSRKFVVSQFPMDGRDSLPKVADNIDTKLCTPGIIRVLGCWGKRDRPDANLIPNTKKHEIFLPWPQGAKWPHAVIPDHVIERFHRLCDERTEASKNDDVRLPLEPFHTRRNSREHDLPDPECFRLKDGDLVYFKAKPGTNGEICEIALSSIWRGEVTTLNGAPASAYDFFRTIDPELTPFRYKSRTVVTRAEQMFGFVEDEGTTDEQGGRQKKPGEPGGLALASRIRLSNATLIEERPDALLPEVTLKILSGPKPPSPSMYFKPAGARRGSILKRDLKPGEHAAMGRKVYLHHPDCMKEPPAAEWRTGAEHENAEQKSRIRPLRGGLVFQFHLDFDNLTREELALLIFSLRPSPEFRHKLGMGKPLGLGSVKVDVGAYLEIDRQQRYTFDGLFAPRYATAHLALKEADAPPQWGRDLAGAGVLADGTLLTTLRDEHRKWMEEKLADALRALVLTGEPQYVRAKVHTPTVDGRPSEQKTFEWFVQNDRSAAPQSLTPIDATTRELPVLNPPVGGTHH